MEFHEKLQELRKQKGLTQEELAQELFVSRTAISKWESGRGYPSIDSLKAIAKFFSVTIDELLSGDEMLTIAEEDHKEKTRQFRDLVFGFLDCSVLMFFFLPFFGQKKDGVIYEVSLLSLTEIEPYVRSAYVGLLVGMILIGILTFALRGFQWKLWERNKTILSLLVSGMVTLLFIMSLQPYAAAFLFVFLGIKVLLLTKKG